MLQINGIVFHFDGFFHRNNMHADTGASGRHHLRKAVQWDKCHTLEKACQCRMFPDTLVALRSLFHIKELRGTRHKHRQTITSVTWSVCLAVVVIVVAVIIFQQTDIAHFINQLLKIFSALRRNTVLLPQLLYFIMMTQFHFKRNVRHLICNNLRKPPIFRILGCKPLHLV